MIIAMLEIVGADHSVDAAGKATDLFDEAARRGDVIFVGRIDRRRFLTIVGDIDADVIEIASYPFGKGRGFVATDNVENAPTARQRSDESPLTVMAFE